MTKAQIAEQEANVRKMKSARFWAGLNIFVFLAASMAANVASARHNMVSWLVAGAVPFAFFMTSHLLVHTGNIRAKWAVMSLMGGMMGITGVVSYQHIRHLCLEAGENVLNASLLPIAVDIPIVLATIILVANAKKVQANPVSPTKLPQRAQGTNRTSPTIKPKAPSVPKQTSLTKVNGTPVKV